MPPHRPTPGPRRKRSAIGSRMPSSWALRGAGRAGRPLLPPRRTPASRSRRSLRRRSPRSSSESSSGLTRGGDRRDRVRSRAARVPLQPRPPSQRGRVQPRPRGVQLLRRWLLLQRRRLLLQRRRLSRGRSERRRKPCRPPRRRLARSLGSPLEGFKQGVGSVLALPVLWSLLGGLQWVGGGSRIAPANDALPVFFHAGVRGSFHRHVSPRPSFGGLAAGCVLAGGFPRVLFPPLWCSPPRCAGAVPPCGLLTRS